jgi:DNA-binding transcriptional MerR regulator
VKARLYQVKELAELAGVSVRTLHHYDEIGLLVPKARTEAGYRLYDESELLRLQQILIGRELGLSLEQIRSSLDDPRFDRRAALLSQREQLLKRAQHTAAMIAAIDAALAVLEKKEGDSVDMKAIFDGFDPARYEDEARRRWGDTDAYKESTKRTKGYTEADWQRFAAEQSAVYAACTALQRAGAEASSVPAMDAAERHRLLIDRWFYPCSRQMHLGLADLYENDARFAASIDRFGEGLTAFLVAAIRANAERSSG